MHTEESSELDLDQELTCDLEKLCSFPRGLCRRLTQAWDTPWTILSTSQLEAKPRVQ